MKRLRTALGYAAMAVGVTVGGVVVGAIVVAPAVSRSKSLIARTFSNSAATEETGGAVGQADGDPMNAGSMATVAAVAPFKPLTANIASEAKSVPAAVSVRRSVFGRFKYEVADQLDSMLIAASRVSNIFWFYADISVIMLLAGVWFWRRRQPAAAGIPNILSAQDLDKRLVAALPSKLVPGKGSRTPKAVATLAEAGTSPADIARRTGLALDAVLMLISMGSFGARQLQPPTA